ncbi:unnamed protein product [Sphenostylis stenocarpa]|uniref:2-oxoglutarate-dependent dioxygenase DAO n=1 Tax=Sphenostylis stenocarpa TaxID=92480 RepID=A0AA86RUW3_9FABA|nr:unnamed protein product [Sphenostylis stenocarpa]
MEEKFSVVIDVEKICEEGECKKLREACEKWGCFRIINHSIPATLMGEMRKVVEALCELPLETKKRNIEDIGDGGYAEPNTLSAFYEALGVYDISSSQAIHNFCSQLHASPHQRQIMEAYGQALHGLAVKIGQKMAQSLGVVHGVDFEDWLYEFRFNNYNFTPEAVGSIGIPLHTDSGFLTFLKDDENVGGLEVKDSSGSFVPIPPFPGTFLVLLGDIARVWSNGRFCNLEHQVQCKDGNKRLSISTLILAPKNRNVEAPEELVDHHHPRLYHPFTYEDYRNVRASKKVSLTETLELFRLV